VRVDETMMKWLMAAPAGKKRDIEPVGLSYMLMGETNRTKVQLGRSPNRAKE
jgi:hypothetical protein